MASAPLVHADDSKTPPRPRPQDVQVGVLHDRTILLDNKPDALSDIAVHFSTAAKAHGMVWYYRNVSATPTPAGERSIDAVIDLVAKYKLPITMSTRPDYSDYVDMRDGQAHPRPAL